MVVLSEKNQNELIRFLLDEKALQVDLLKQLERNVIMVREAKELNQLKLDFLKDLAKSKVIIDGLPELGTDLKQLLMGHTNQEEENQ